MANAINSLNYGDNTYTFTLPYGVCSTAASTKAKTVTVDNFSLETGATIIVKFTYANSVSSPTLNVNGTGAKPIYRYGTTVASSGTTTSGWVAGAVQMFTYDGTGWIRDYWNNTTYSNASMGTGYATCTTAAATTAKVGTLSSYALSTGGIVSVKFTYAVPANATLNINSKGAKAIYYRGSAITANVIEAGDVATFVYNGSYYHLISIDRWHNDIVELQANDSKVKQIPSSANGNFKLLLTPDSQTGTTTAYTYYDSGVYLNPYYNKIYGVDIDGNAAGLEGLTAKIDELNYMDGVFSNVQEQLNNRAYASHDHKGLAIHPAAIELAPAGTTANNGGYIDFHYNRGGDDYTSRIIEEVDGIKLAHSNGYSGRILVTSNIIALYNVSVTFSSGKATYSNSAIKSSSVCIVQRRSGTAGSATTSMYATTSNNGSLTIVTDNTSATNVNLNIFIFNL